MTNHKALPRLEGHVALVTGAGTGIGLAAAEAFTREGARVALVGRRRGPLEHAAETVRSAGGEPLVVPADVSDPGAVTELVRMVVERWGRLDVAFNNAGITHYAPIADISVEDFDRVMATNVRGVWLLLKLEIEVMRRMGRGGAIVNTSSIAATGGWVGLSVYAASKGALDSMIRPLALEAGPQGIRVNNVSPGVVDTPLTADLPKEARDSVASHAALQRIGTPADVAAAVVWLCTPEARFITGQSVQVDGGFGIAGAR